MEVAEHTRQEYIVCYGPCNVAGVRQIDTILVGKVVSSIVATTVSLWHSSLLNNYLARYVCIRFVVGK